MCCWNTFEIVLFETSNSMKPYASSAVYAHTSELRPVIALFEPNDFDEASNRIPPTSHICVCEKTLLLPEPWPSNPAAELHSSP